jgi:hypothetical protein
VNHDPLLGALRDLPELPPPVVRAEAIRLRARSELSASHARHVLTLRAVRLGLAFALTGGLLVYLLWAMSVSRTFG